MKIADIDSLNLLKENVFLLLELSNEDLYYYLRFLMINKNIEMFDFVINELDIIDQKCYYLFIDCNQYGDIDFLESLLKNKKINPAANSNYLIRDMLSKVQGTRIPKNLFIMRQRLYKDNRIKETLPKNNNDLAKKLMEIEIKWKLKNI
jgi:predicted acetyltransferase